MSKRVFSGKTVSEAINKGLIELGVAEQDVVITVIEQPTKGLLGLFGAKEAKVELELKPAVVHTSSVASSVAVPEPVADALTPTAQAKSYFALIVREMGVGADIEERSDEEGNTVFHVSGKELGVLIGRRGQTLDALQTLVNVYASRLSGGHPRIVIDAENFREKRKRTLQDLSLRLANQVIRSKKEVVLEPMPPHERRIIHTHLQNHPKVRTFSRGEEPNRRIVITLKS